MLRSLLSFLNSAPDRIERLLSDAFQFASLDTQPKKPDQSHLCPYKLETPPQQAEVRQP